MNQPPLKPLHDERAMIQSKLAQFRKLSTDELIESLAPSLPGALKTRPDGKMLDGHHHVVVLHERGFEVDDLPREIIPLDES